MLAVNVMKSAAVACTVAYLGFLRLHLHLEKSTTSTRPSHLRPDAVVFLEKTGSDETEKDSTRVVTENPNGLAGHADEKPEKSEQHAVQMEDTLTGYTRAVLGYMPPHNTLAYEEELRWLIESWKEMQKYEPHDWRTDIVVVVQEDIPTLFNELNCTKIHRTNRTEPNTCRFVPGYTMDQASDDVLKHYKYADSIRAVPFAHAEGALDGYDAILRTDLDTFLTPTFSTWKPEKLAVGQGGYCFDGQITCKRLRQIALDMGLAPPDHVPIVENVGSTWYGPTSTVVKCSKLSVEVMEHLEQNEFTYDDKFTIAYSPDSNNWPGWHYHVMTMYSGHIAINYCGQETGFEKRPDMLDTRAVSNDSIYEHAHIHTWHDLELFNKFEFHRGGYKNVSIEDLNTTIIHDYALAMALRSREIAAQNRARTAVEIAGNRTPKEPADDRIGKTQKLAQQANPNGFTRAVIGYMSPYNTETFETEFKWLFESWKEMQKHEPLNWRTDIIVVMQGNITPFFEELHCTKLHRTNRTEPSTCRVLDGYKKDQTGGDVLKDYEFADIIHSVSFAHAQGALSGYDALLRTELDIFLTPRFSMWRPANLAVSAGTYCLSGQITCTRLGRVARNMKLAPPEGVPAVDNIGFTWYGPTDTVVECVKLSVEVMNHLAENEFTDADKYKIAYNPNTNNWPGWHYHVMHMYGGQIAVNHCGQKIGFEKRPDMLDVETTSDGSVNEHAHLRTSIDQGAFSKREFHNGAYETVAVEELNTTIIRDYALAFALRSRQIHAEKQ